MTISVKYILLQVWVQKTDISTFQIRRQTFSFDNVLGSPDSTLTTKSGSASGLEGCVTQLPVSIYNGTKNEGGVLAKYIFQKG